MSLASALKGEYGLAIGNIVGSNIFNLLAVVGIAATIEPASLPPSVLSLHIFVMVAFTLVLFAMTYDYDGQIRMDCSSPYAMASLIEMKDRFDVAFGNDTDTDRHGIVTRGAGLLNPNHYLAVAVWYLFQNRPDWNMRNDSANLKKKSQSSARQSKRIRTMLTC